MKQLLPIFENKDARFYDNSIDKYCSRKDSELTQMEEDVLYMSLFKESLNVVIKEDLATEYHNE